MAITLLITYGSLYPFRFSLHAYDRDMLAGLFYFGLGHSSRGDLVGNVALFVPFGFFAMAAFSRHPTALRWFAILIAGFVVAFAIQALQLFVPARTPSGSDAIWNLLGCALGSALGMLRRLRTTRLLHLSEGQPIIPVALALLWIAYHWAPFIPSLVDLQLLKSNLKQVLSDPTYIPRIRSAPFRDLLFL